MITFKQFLEDVYVDNELYTKRDSQADINNAESKSNLKPALRGKLKGKGWKSLGRPFKDPAFSVLWERKQYSVNVILVNKEASEVAVSVSFDEVRDIEVENGKISYLEVGTLSSNEKYRGKGLPAALYEFLIENGQILVSSDSQTSGGKATWETLTEQTSGHVMALVRSYNLEHLFPKVKETDNDYVLVSGSLAKLNKLVYRNGRYGVHWIILPKSTTNIEDLISGSIKL